MDKIGEILRRSGDINPGLCRKPKAFRFCGGDAGKCENLLLKLVSAMDGTVGDAVATPQLRQVAEWMADTKGRGLLLTGSVGSGKTTLLRCVPPVFQLKGLAVHYVTARELGRNGVDFRRLLCVDDVGTEPVRNDFGERSEPFADFMDAAEDSLNPVFVSTNLTGRELAARYGVRTVDRLAGRCLVVRFDGKTMRR